MTDQAEPDYPQLSREELLALKFAVHRQLSRWSSKPLVARKQAQRDALLAAVRSLDDDRLARGCQLRPTLASA